MLVHRHDTYHKSQISFFYVFLSERHERNKEMPFQGEGKQLASQLISLFSQL